VPGAAGGGHQMKTFTIRLPEVEAAMLAELQKKNPKIKDLAAYLVELIRVQYKDLCRR
jgi:hypothetical protein